MKSFFIFFIFSTLLLSSCSDESALAPLARKHFPGILERDMKEQLGTVGKPEMKNIETVYDCDSICVIQAKVSGRDRSGNIKRETVRYIFVLDTYISRATGNPVYYHILQGAAYLDSEGKNEFCRRMREEEDIMYPYYLKIAEPLYLFSD